MAQRSGSDLVPPLPSPGAVGRAATRAGRLLIAAALPLTAVTFLLLVRRAPSALAAVDVAAAAATGPLSGGGIDWLFHVGVLGVLAGSWLLGAGLVVTGLAE